MKPKRACYWIVGQRNPHQAPAVAIDLHAGNGELVTHTKTYALPNRWQKHQHAARQIARVKAKAYAKSQGVTDLTFDPDSTDCFATC
jgi:hypothetical protein